MKYTKALKYITALSTIVILTGCNDSTTVDVEPIESETSMAETTTPQITTTEVITTPRELTIQERLQNTAWAGADGNGNILYVIFTNSQVTIESNGYRTDVSGYWDIDDEQFTVYSDIALTEQITYYEYSLTDLGNGSSVLYMENLCLTQTNSTALTFDTISEDFISQYATLETVTEGSYWVGANSINADFFVCNYGDIYIYIAEFGSTETTYYDGRWGITYGNSLYMIDSESSQFILFNWEFDETTEKLYLTPTDAPSVEPLEFCKTDSTNFSDAIYLVNCHLDGTYTETMSDQTTVSFEYSYTQESESSISEALETDYFGNEIQSNENVYYNNPDDVNSNPDDEDYNDYTEYFDNYTKAPENLYPQYYYTTQATQYYYDYDYNYDY